MSAGAVGPRSLGRRVVAEGLGTGFLLAAVIGSGIMGERLAGGNVAVALLANTLPCSPTRRPARQHAPVFVNVDGLIACSPPCSRFCGCAPKFCVVREDSRLCSRAAPPVR